MAASSVGYRIISVILLCILIILLWVMRVESSDWYGTNPTTKNGKPWNIGYAEGGPYINYPANLMAIAEGLIELGWIEQTALEEVIDPEDSKSIWAALAKSDSAFLRFDPRAYYTANWDQSLRTENRAAAIDQLRLDQIDFIIAMGTWAGQDLANDLHEVPVMVVSSSDPVKSGIVKSASYSGYDHVHAKCDPYRYIRQVQLFHDIVGFKHLGVVYENSLDGRSYAALDDIENVAARQGFQTVTCEAPWSGVSQSVSTQFLIACHKALAPRIDALYLTVHTGVDPKQMDKILAPLIEYQIPTWSQRGAQEVRDGALMSISRGGFGPVGKYHAAIMAKILNGAKPVELKQIFEDPRKIAINLTTAKAIGFTLPKGLLKVADDIYE